MDVTPEAGQAGKGSLSPQYFEVHLTRSIFWPSNSVKIIFG